MDCKEKNRPKIVAIGGGTGLSVLLRSLKTKCLDITAVVTVADDGGGSGRLRDDLNILPPGDIRSCIVALSKTEPIMEKVIRYRFTDGVLKGQSLGNLFLAAMTEIEGGNFVQAVQQLSEVLNVSGRVLPVTDANIDLVATLENGKKIVGESKIGHSSEIYGSKISKIELTTKNRGISDKVEALPQVIEAIENADIITLGPGSLYTSVIPNLIVPGVKEAIERSAATVVYICNIMTQPGETDGHNAREHYNAIIRHTSKGLVNCVVVNTGKINEGVYKRYIEQGADLAEYKRNMFDDAGVRVIEGDLVSMNKKNSVRHNNEKLADILMNICEESRRNKEKGNGKVLFTAD